MSMKLPSTLQRTRKLNVSWQAAAMREALLGNKTVLPPTWRLMTSEDGKPFYYNVETKVTQWDPPLVMAPVHPPQPREISHNFDHQVSI